MDPGECCTGGSVWSVPSKSRTGNLCGTFGFALGFVAHRYNTLAASMLMHMFYNLMGTLIVDLESRFLPAIVMGMIILISIPMTVSAVTLICLTTNNKKTEV